MPIYQFQCNCDAVKEEFRKMGEFYSPDCSICGSKMIYMIGTPSVILKGQGWNHGSQEKLRNRSREQGRKFFRKHEDLKDKSANFKYPE